MPLGRTEDDGRSGVVPAGFDQLLRLFDNLPLDGLPLGVLALEVRGDLLRFLRAPGRQQFDDEPGVAESTGGIEARGQSKAHVFGADRFVVGEPGGGEQRTDTDRRPGDQSLQSVLDDHSVFILQRHDIGDEAERRQTEQVEERFAQFGADPVAAAGALGDGPREFEGDRRTGQSGERILRPGQPRMDEHIRGRQCLLHLVVIGDDQFDADFAGDLRFLHAANPAIDGDEQLLPLRRQFADGLGIQPVALVESMRDVIPDVGPEFLEHRHQDGRAGRTVHIVITVHNDFAARLHGAPNPRGGVVDPRQQFGWVQRAHRGMQEALGHVRLADTPVPEELRHHRRHPGNGGQPAQGRVVVGDQMPIAGCGRQADLGSWEVPDERRHPHIGRGPRTRRNRTGNPKNAGLLLQSSSGACPAPADGIIQVFSSRKHRFERERLPTASP